jgi:hypothetical protein
MCAEKPQSSISKQSGHGLAATHQGYRALYSEARTFLEEITLKTAVSMVIMT